MAAAFLGVFYAYPQAGIVIATLLLTSSIAVLFSLWLRERRQP